MAIETEAKKGVTGFGFVTNLKTFTQEANSYLNPTEAEFKSWEINNLVDRHIASNSIEFRNKQGKQVAKEQLGFYAIFKTEKKTPDGENILAYYERPRIEKKLVGHLFFCRVKT